jgi:hypothetical protein
MRNLSSPEGADSERLPFDGAQNAAAPHRHLAISVYFEPRAGYRAQRRVRHCPREAVALSGDQRLSVRAWWRYDLAIGKLFEQIRSAVASDRFFVACHADERCEERGISAWKLVTGLEEAELI